MRLLGCMHGCKNVPSTTGWCEIKARAPFPHNAMLNKKRRVFCRGLFFRTIMRSPCTQHCIVGNGARAFISHTPVVLGTFLHPCPASPKGERGGGHCTRTIPGASRRSQKTKQPLNTTTCNELSKRQGMGTSLWWQMRVSGVEYYRTYENFENR